MQTTNDLDLELIFSLGEEVEKHCEGSLHPTHQLGHDDGPLWYTLFTACKCSGDEIVIRCDGFLSQCEREIIEFADGMSFFICDECEFTYYIHRLEPVKP